MIIHESVGQNAGALRQSHAAEYVFRCLVFRGADSGVCKCDGQRQGIRFRIAVRISKTQQSNREEWGISAKLRPVSDTNRLDLPAFSSEPWLPCQEERQDLCFENFSSFAFKQISPPCDGQLRHFLRLRC